MKDYLFYYYFNCLSNFYPSVFVDKNGTIYKNLEQYINYRKAICFNDIALANKVLETSDPFESRKIISELDCDPKAWDSMKMDIIRNGMILKFTQNIWMGRYLVNTKPKKLIFSDSNDSDFGIGFSVDQAPKTYEKEWGYNKMGILLMDVREFLVNSGICD